MLAFLKYTNIFASCTIPSYCVMLRNEYVAIRKRFILERNLISPFAQRTYYLQSNQTYNLIENALRISIGGMWWSDLRCNDECGDSSNNRKSMGIHISQYLYRIKKLHYYTYVL